MRHHLVWVALAIAGCSSSARSQADRSVPDGANGTGGGSFGGGAGFSGAGGSGGTGGGTPGCRTNAECVGGFTCDNGRCVPPEQEQNRGLGDAPPIATPRYVYALNPTAASVARIDPVSLLIEAIAVGPRPLALVALPGEDAALVLSFDDSSLSVIDSRTLPSKVTRVPLKRQYSRLTLSPDGRFAVAWPDPSTAPPSGAEGVFALVEIERLRTGATPAQAVSERAGGFRITDVVFRTEAARTTRLSVFAKSTISTFDLTNPAASLPTRLTLPASFSSEISSREVVATQDGRVVLLRSTVAPELAAFDGTALNTVPLSEVATDLDLLPDGTAAVAALRSAGSVAWIEIPADLTAPSGIEVFRVADGGVGQVALPESASDAGVFAFVWSNVAGDESVSRVDFPSGRVVRYPVEKLVDEVAVSPDSRSALIIHRSNAATTATDPYEAAVDRDEGFSVFDVPSGFAQLQRTGTTKPTRYAFSPRGGFVGVALRNDALRRYQLQAVNLSSLVSTTLPLASTPLYMGTVPEAPGITPHRVFVSQQHPAGRISVIQLDTGQVRTATGFTLNWEIQ
ncbi:MAG: hypothetical protein SFW67_02505 [Myxococcaceae bacterium]|nr:hypothetical protein [Myxococcaceae bacterium]